ncbi:3-hydroxybutyrate dehydrogenase [Acidisoma silvae]|uniref:3-hydroxybutyrate dehydrogenase n=1 Tax=Acidisoma silvae TaxID=2802396 RepID=A0A964DY74_9PROT|nr:3-hydroxybutyrate dehydrogenase [Acidisoma silvae]MCB8874458.1 3-hydroxybutyrate dehydrogenase [Acidisoma silvae]
MSLRGKVAVVTGSTSGIGLGVARAFAAEGADIVINGFGKAEDIERERAALVADFGVKALYSGADLSTGAGVRQLVADAEAGFGRVDILVNNAGIQFVADIVDFPEDRWDAIIAINLSSAFHGIKAAAPGMKARGWGRIINIASAHGLVASGQKSAYVAAKHGLVGLTKVAGIELANTGVTCNAICPGWVLTPLVEKQLHDRAGKNGTSFAQEQEALVAEKQPMKQFTSPAQIGALAVFLCSDGAATITGAPLSIDGGWVAQ